MEVLRSCRRVGGYRILCGESGRDCTLYMENHSQAYCLEGTPQTGLDTTRLAVEKPRPEIGHVQPTMGVDAENASSCDPNPGVL